MTPSDLTRLREDLGWSQNRLAQEIRVNRSTINKWESGQHPIPAMAETLLMQLTRRISRRISSPAVIASARALRPGRPRPSRPAPGTPL